VTNHSVPVDRSEAISRHKKEMEVGCENSITGCVPHLNAILLKGSEVVHPDEEE
jgi:hypothetical protein